MRSWLMLAVSAFGSVVMKEKTSCSTVSPFFFSGPLYRVHTPGKAKTGRASLPLIENQCHVAGFSPFGSQ